MPNLVKNFEVDSATCWFCEKNSSDHVLEITQVNRTITQVTAYTKTIKQSSVKVPIPRCSRCAAIHRWVYKSRNIWALVTTPIGIILSFLISGLFTRNLKAMESGNLFAVLVGLFGLGMGSSLIIGEIILRSIKKKKYPDELFGKSKIRLNNLGSVLKHPQVRKYFVVGYNQVQCPKY